MNTPLEQSPQTWKGNAARFLSAQTLSLFGSSLVQFAIIWHITLSTSSGAMLTISTVCGFGPQLLMALFGGQLIDRYDRKRVIMLTDAAIALSTLLLAGLMIGGFTDTWLLFVALAIRSAGSGIQTPAVNAFIPQITPKTHLMKVVGINSTLTSITMFLSPAASGVALSLAPIPYVLLIDVVTAIMGIAVTATVKAMPSELPVDTHPRQSALRSFSEGLTYLKRDPFVKRLLVYQIIIMFLISPSAFLTPLLVERTFGAEIWFLTASEMSYSFGMIAGGLLITLWGGAKNRMRTTLIAGIAYGCLMVGIGAAPLFGAYLVINALIGITAPVYNAPITVTLQERVDSAFHGRVFGFMQIATSSALPLGMVLFGPLADIVEVRWIIIAAGVLAVAVSVTATVKRSFT